MSKIARVFHLNKEIQKIYKNGVLQKLFFDWKKYIGEEINIEYARGYCSNRININGKVYQNLASKLYIGAGNTLMSTETKALEPNGYTHIKLPYPLKPNTSYTIVIDVKQPSEEHAFQLRNAKMEYLTLTIPTLTNKLVKGMNAATFTTSSNEISAILIKNAQNSTKDLIIKNNVIVIEGDLSGETIIEDSIKYLEEGTFVPENRIIEGKTYQNLLTNKIDYTFSGSAFYYNKTTLNNGAIYTRNNEEITSEVYGTYITLKCHKVASMLKSNTTYTLAFNIESTFSDYKGITVSGENDCYFKSSTSESNGTRYFHNESFDLSTGYKKIMFETNSNITQYFGFGFPLMQSQSEGTYLKITNIILLEGDYTSIDLPDNINGIESVSERENINLLKDIKWYDGFINMTTGKIEGVNSSYPDAKYTDLIDIDSSILYITNLPQNSNKSRIRTYSEDGTNLQLGINTFDELYKKDEGSRQKVSKIRILMLYGSTIPENPYLIKDGEPPDKVAYYINERTYNYECESDGIVLPNGVKNTIEEVNGVMNYVQRVGKIIIDGTQVMRLINVSQTQTSRIYIPLDNAKESKGMNNLLCNWYIRNGEHGDYEYIIIQYITSLKGMTLFISVLNSKLETTNLNGIIKYFKENPLSVYYELINPIYNPLYDSKEMINTPILPNGLQDELTLRDSGFKRIQKMNTIILNGSENWSLRVSNDDFSVYNCAGLNILKTSTDYGKSSSKMICEQFAPSDISSMVSTSITKEGICLRQSGTGFILSISNSKLDTQDLAGFKSYLQSNPVTVTYELDTQNIVDTNLTYPFENDTFDITLPLGQKDTIECGYVIKRVWKLTVDNTTTFNFPTSLVKDNTVLISIPVTSITKLYDATVSAICDTLEFKNIYDLDETGFYINKAGNTLYIRLLISDYGSTLSEVTEKLKTNKIVIYYPLLNEIKIPYINKININQPLRSLPNGVCDTIENGKLIQRVGKIIFDGSDDENWHNGYSADGKNNRFQISFAISTNLNESESRIGYCDRFFIELTRAIPSVGGMRITYSKELLYMLFNPSTDIVPLEDLSAWKTWLSENPVTVYYELTNPVETELNLHTISVKEGTNFITTTNNIKPNIQAECLVRCNETNMLNVKEFVGDANVIIDKIKVEKGTTYLFTFTNNLGENDANNTPNIIVTDKNISIISNTHNTLYGATIGVNLGVAYTYKSGYQFTSNYDYVYITSCNAKTTSKNLSDMCLKRV